MQIQGLHGTARMSIASPRLLVACASGDHFRNAVLSGQGPAGDFLKIALDDVLVTAYATAGSEAASPSPVDSFALAFSKIRVEYRPQKPDGSLGPPAKAGWDVKASRKL